MNNDSKTIPVGEASVWTENWRSTHPNDTRAFLIPSGDLLAALAEMGIIAENSDGTYSIGDVEGTGVRAYMSIDHQGEQKLLIVGTRKEGDNYKDIIEEESASQVAGSGVFDFTTPCPTVCDPDSPLN